MSPADKSLDSLRREIDSIDEAMHDLLMRRAQLAGRIRQAKGPGDAPIYRPGREASILRRLIARHTGPLPPAVVVRVWREIISGLSVLQGPISVAVFAPTADMPCLVYARDHFGVLTPMRTFAKVGPLIAAIRDGAHPVGLLPLGDEAPTEPWWRHLGGPGPHSLQILARLPFLHDANDGVAVVVGRQPFEPTGEDRGFLLVETDREISRTALKSLTEQAGVRALGLRGEAHEQDGRAGRHWLYLVETERYIRPDDIALAEIVARAGAGHVQVRPVGGYAIPPATATPAAQPALAAASSRRK
jgi:chorismate mutase / prephenate dehydratase